MINKNIWLIMLLRVLKENNKNILFSNNYDDLMREDQFISFYSKYVSPLIIFNYVYSKGMISNALTLKLRKKFSKLTEKYLKWAKKISFIVINNKINMNDLMQFCHENGIYFNKYYLNHPLKPYAIIFDFYDRSLGGYGPLGLRIKYIIPDIFSLRNFINDFTHLFEDVVRQQKKWKKKFFYKGLNFSDKIKYCYYSIKNKQEN